MLHWAAEEGHAEVVQLVIDEYSLDPTAHDKVSAALCAFKASKCGCHMVGQIVWVV